MRNTGLHLLAFVGLVLIAGAYATRSLPVDLAFFFAATVTIVLIGGELMRRDGMTFPEAVKDMVSGPATRKVGGSRLIFAATVILAVLVDVQTFVLA